MNWRKPLIHALLRLSGSDVPRRLRGIADLCARPPGEILRFQQQRLERLLQFAWQNVPYYREVLARAGAVEADGTVLILRPDGDATPGARIA